METKAKATSRVQQLVTTAAVFYSFIAMGSSLTFLPLSLLKFTQLLEITLSDISFVFTVRFVANLIGSLICGLLFKFGNRYIIITALSTMQGLAIVFIPTWSNVYFFAAMIAIQSGCYGAIITAGFSWIPEIWKNRAAPIIQAQHFCFALGTLIPPLIFKPFFAEVPLPTSATLPISNSTIAKEQITIPCGITGTYVAAAALFYIIGFCFGTPNKPSTEQEDHAADHFDEKPASEVQPQATKDDTSEEPPSSPMTKYRRLALIALGALFYGGSVSMEISVLMYMPSYIRFSSPELPETVGAEVLSFFTAAFTVGRLIGIILSFRLKSEQILSGNFVLIAAAHVLLYFRGSSILLLKIGCVLAGMGFSTTYASFFELMKNIIPITNAVSSSFVVGGGLGCMLYLTTLGNLLETYPDSLLFMNFGALAYCTCILITILCGFKK